MAGQRDVVRAARGPRRARFQVRPCQFSMTRTYVMSRQPDLRRPVRSTFALVDRSRYRRNRGDQGRPIPVQPTTPGAFSIDSANGIMREPLVQLPIFRADLSSAIALANKIRLPLRQSY